MDFEFFAFPASLVVGVGGTTTVSVGESGVQVSGRRTTVPVGRGVLIWSPGVV